jgi:hypothetical protein
VRAAVCSMMADQSFCKRLPLQLDGCASRAPSCHELHVTSTEAASQQNAICVAPWLQLAGPLISPMTALAAWLRAGSTERQAHESALMTAALNTTLTHACTAPAPTLKLHCASLCNRAAPICAGLALPGHATICPLPCTPVSPPAPRRTGLGGQCHGVRGGDLLDLLLEYIGGWSSVCSIDTCGGLWAAAPSQ